jgi:NIPSNAP
MRDFAYVLTLASAFIPTALATEASCCGVMELRQYTLKPGQRDVFVELFEREFIETQEARPIRIVGLFHDLDRPERVVWLRGFPDMAARKRALTDFYGGPVWKAHRNAANATMIDSDDVLLLRPLHAETVFPDTPLPPRDAAPRARGVVEARLLYAASEIPQAHIDAAVEALDAAVREAGGARLGVYVSEHAPNDFPGLPVREGEHVLAWFASIPDEASRKRLHDALAGSPAWRQAEARLTAGAPREPEALRLSPTARSRVPAASAVH